MSGELVDRILAHQIPTSGERRVITVMFIDMKNFTALSESIPPQTLIKVLNMYFAYCIDILRKYGGFIDKFIGDALMVEFGVPIPDPRHRENAVRCAVELHRCCSRLQEKIQSLGLDWRLEFGIGINSGEAIVGNLGTPERMEYTALGDTVNTASRIEGITRRFQKPIVIGADTWCDEIKDLLEEGQRVSLRGKKTPVTVHVVKVDD